MIRLQQAAGGLLQPDHSQARLQYIVYSDRVPIYYILARAARDLTLTGRRRPVKVRSLASRTSKYIVYKGFSPRLTATPASVTGFPIRSSTRSASRSEVELADCKSVDRVCRVRSTRTVVRSFLSKMGPSAPFWPKMIFRRSSSHVHDRLDCCFAGAFGAHEAQS